MIQPARGRVGRVLASILSLSGAAFASGMTYGSKNERTDKKNPSVEGPYFTRKGISVDLKSGGQLKGNKYEPVAPYLDGAGKGKVVLLLSGSGGTNLGQLKPVANKYCKMGSTVYGIDYRSYGGSDENSMLSEQGFNNDAKAMFNFVIGDSGVASTDVVIHGFSLGGAIAAKLVKSLAKEGLKVGGLVLHSAIDSAYKAARDDSPINLPIFKQLAGLINKAGAGNFDTRAKLKEIAALDPDLPIHLMSGKHGKGDQLGLDHTHLDDKARKHFGNVTSHVSDKGDHLETEEAHG
jgi:pimeloyl-ACP methyl ester carboxylesterase